MSLIDILFPKECLGCKKEGSYICNKCIEKVSHAKLLCPVCERPSIDGMTHSKCQKPYSLNGLVSLWKYQGVVRKAIISLKYKYAESIAQELFLHFFNRLLKTELILPQKTVLTPIPLYWYRENFRGFNQSQKIGKLIAEKFDWNFTGDLLIRKKMTVSQTQLKGKDRTENVRGVFALNPKYESLVRGYKFLVIFDDVWTTGSTLKEATKVLKRNGMENVWGLTVAR